MKSAAIDVTTFSEARANLKSVMDKVVQDHVPVIISRRRAEPVVMISLEDWNAIQAAGDRGQGAGPAPGGVEERSSRFEGLRGRAGEGLSTDEIMALTRGEE